MNFSALSRHGAFVVLLVFYGAILALQFNHGLASGDGHGIVQATQALLNGGQLEVSRPPGHPTTEFYLFGAIGWILQKGFGVEFDDKVYLVCQAAGALATLIIFYNLLHRLGADLGHGHSSALPRRDEFTRINPWRCLPDYFPSFYAARVPFALLDANHRAAPVATTNPVAKFRFRDLLYCSHYFFSGLLSPSVESRAFARGFAVSFVARGGSITGVGSGACLFHFARSCSEYRHLQRSTIRASVFCSRNLFSSCPSKAVLPIGLPSETFRPMRKPPGRDHWQRVAVGL